MQVKKFEAPTMAEALKLIKTELGPDAIILSTKKHKKGFGLLSKASVEITAAVSDKSLVRKKITDQVLPEEAKARVEKMSSGKQSDIIEKFSTHYLNKITKRKNKIQQAEQNKLNSAARYIDITDDDTAPATRTTNAAPATASAYGRNARVATPTNTTMPTQTNVSERTSVNSSVAMQTLPKVPVSVSTDNLNDINSLKGDVHKLKTLIEEMKLEQGSIISGLDGKLPDGFTEELNQEFQNLLRNGIDRKYASTLVKQVGFELSSAELRNSQTIIEALAVELMSNVKLDNPLDFKPGSGQKVLAFIGSTGVGKTTTIAKIASFGLLHKNFKVGLINVDTYKVAAQDQLSTYARILNVPFRQVATALDLERALAEFKPLDLVLIDTGGCSQKDSESIARIRSLLEVSNAIRPVLVMSASTRDQELQETVNRFRHLNPTGLLFSKLDESSTFGCIYNLAVRSGLPLTFFTTGQRVPEDIEEATRERVADLIVDL